MKNTTKNLYFFLVKGEIGLEIGISFGRI